MDMKEAKMDFKSILKEVEYLGSAHMTWREKKELENKKVVSLGGKPQKKQRLPLSVARVMMKKQKEREEKMQEENLILGRFGGNNASSSRKAAGRRRPEDRVLKSTEGHFRNGVLDVKELLKPSSAPKAASFDAKQSFSSGKGKKKKGGKKNKGNKNKGGPDKELDEETFLNKYGNDNSAHVPVLLGEVLDVFTSVTLRSFLDCTLGSAGHSSAIIRAHSEMQVYVGLDVDPIAHQLAQSQLKSIIDRNSFDTASALKVHTFLKNFKDVKSVLGEVEDDLLVCGVDGILMDLGMSSMQVNDAARGFSVLKNGPLDMRMNPKATLKAEDVLNSWPADEVGRVLREYGEESNWYSLQNRIVKARLHGGLHSTNELVDLIKNSTSRTKGRQGWIKTATRVFQALRIAVNDELKTLEDSIHASFESLSSGGRLAVISFHSLEDRIVKQAFLNIMNRSEVDRGGVEDEEGKHLRELRKINLDTVKEEAWVKQVIQGHNGTILTKRPITPSEKEETLNPRSRSAKLRVIQKA